MQTQSYYPTQPAKACISHNTSLDTKLQLKCINGASTTDYFLNKDASNRFHSNFMKYKPQGVKDTRTRNLKHSKSRGYKQVTLTQPSAKLNRSTRGIILKIA
uniref:Uncharacterized protein n=1 Tax=Opuntia streptacantha TaxID=393608 RepID=A0A7C9E5N6_OPUST